MSYRDDLEAALARVDSLEHELGQARKAAAPAPPRPTASHRVAARSAAWPYLVVGAIAVGATAVFALAAGMPGHRQVSIPGADVDPPPVEPAPIRVTHLVECAQNLRPREPSSSSCLADLELAASDAGLGTDIHDVLARWLAFERASELAERDAMLDAIHTLVVHDFTR